MDWYNTSNMNIWDQLPKPLFILAPMENVTDTVFRRVVASAAKPDLFFTEFMHVTGFLSAGNKIVARRLVYTAEETPLIAQIWGTEPDDYYNTAKAITTLGFAGIDINMGCPDKNVLRHGACSALINNHTLAKEIILATKEGAGSLPVSVKTRIGLKKIDTENWVSHLLSLPLTALTIHGRTAAEMSRVPAHYDEIGKAVKIRNEMKSKVYIIANGDISDRTKGLELCEQYGFDGAMIGRGIFGNLWAFEENPRTHSSKEYMEKLLMHTDLFESVWNTEKPFIILRKFYKAYIKDFDGASDLRENLMQTNSFNDVRNTIREYIKKNDTN